MHGRPEAPMTKISCAQRSPSYRPQVGTIGFALVWESTKRGGDRVVSQSGANGHRRPPRNTMKPTKIGRGKASIANPTMAGASHWEQFFRWHLTVAGRERK